MASFSTVASASDSSVVDTSAKYGREPRQEINAIAAATTAVFGLAGVAAPSAWVAFATAAGATGVAVLTTPPYCERCRRITPHRRAPGTSSRRTNCPVVGQPSKSLRRPEAKDPSAAARASEPTSDGRSDPEAITYRCLVCGNEIAKPGQVSDSRDQAATLTKRTLTYVGTQPYAHGAK